MKLTIVSDGTPQGIKCINAETGEAVERLVSIELTSADNALATATIKFHICTTPGKAKS